MKCYMYCDHAIGEFEEMATKSAVTLSHDLTYIYSINKTYSEDPARPIIPSHFREINETM